MTVNSLEVTKCCKNDFILFFMFSNFYVFIFRNIFGRTCYGTTVFVISLDRFVNNTKHDPLIDRKLDNLWPYSTSPQSLCSH